MQACVPGASGFACDNSGLHHIHFPVMMTVMIFVQNILAHCKFPYLIVLRVFKRFCEIQEPPVNLKSVTYEQLKQIVINYTELSKCPELKVR